MPASVCQATAERESPEFGPYYLHYSVQELLDRGQAAEDAGQAEALVAKLRALTPLQELAVLGLLAE